MKFINMALKMYRLHLCQLLMASAWLCFLSLAFVGFARADTANAKTFIATNTQTPKVNIEQANGLTIVASIRPLAFLLNELALPADKVIQLVSNNNSAHHYQLKVSGRRLLNTADLVAWVGPELELFLEKPLRQVRQSGRQSIVTLSEAPGLKWLDDKHQNQQHIDNHDNHAHDEHAHDKPIQDKSVHHEHQHHGRDLHIWLNPINVQAMVTMLAQRLSELSPDNATAYQQKAESLVAALSDLDRDIALQMAVIADKAFTVLHPAYSHFINRYKLNQLDYLVINPESSIGAKHLFELSQYEMVCVFGEVGQANQHIEKIANSSQAKVGQLDPLGSNLADDASITELIRKLADDFQACLA